MFHDEEKKLYKLKENYDNIEIPQNLDDFIIKGIKKGQFSENNVKTRKMISLAASLLIIIFITSIVISPAFADFASRIPGIGYFMNFFNYDKGIQAALENDFIQVINVSDEHDGTKLTVEGVVIDESRMIVFYNIQTQEENADIYLHEIEFLNGSGEHLRAGFVYSPPIFEQENKSFKGTIDISFNEETKITNNLTMICNLVINEKNKEMVERNINDIDSYFSSVHKPLWDREVNGLFKINFNVDTEKYENLKEVYELKKEVWVEGQKFIVQRVSIYPSRTEIGISYDEKNTMKIYGFEDLRIVDKSGNEFSSITNGITASYIGEDGIRLYLQSNFFKHPKELYLEGSTLRALDKSKNKVVIDLEDQIIIEQPDGRFELSNLVENIIDNTIGIEVKYEYEVPVDQMNRFIGVELSHTFTDERGVEYTPRNSGSSATSTEGKHIYTIYNRFDRVEGLGRKITFKLTNYPKTIKAPFRIKIK
ncbi:DUF4179 domain-containing protein [Serpentinicella alkaliphila]|uniref:Uncharacterized protein DUF4179 n=1 Tax=Serpentinicella alkaliphila TaxID=1734049 RepID=A0A4R2TKZ9_9FIRM|nr:DUF4179 domain-containing protein [Serpentinicella alkaliphila]TCQ03102.1 uncharacterized protein DUF4179 [Serpentinicella alkaliphila]